MPVVLQPNRQGRSVLKLSLGISVLALATIIGAVFVIGAPEADAANCTMTAGANLTWSSPLIWSTCNGGYPGQTTTDTAQIGCLSSVNVDVNVPQSVVLTMACTGSTVAIPGTPALNSLQIQPSSTMGSTGNTI